MANNSQEWDEDGFGYYKAERGTIEEGVYRNTTVALLGQMTFMNNMLQSITNDKAGGWDWNRMSGMWRS